MNTLALGNWNWRSRAEQKRNSSWCNCGPTSNGNRARVADDIRPLKELSTIGRAISEEEKQRLLQTAVMRPEWEMAYFAAILCLNSTARGCELKGLQWCDVDLFARTVTIRTSKTAAVERVVHLTDVAIHALARLRRRAEGFGAVEASHYSVCCFRSEIHLHR